MNPGPLYGGSSRSPTASPAAVRLTSEGSRERPGNTGRSAATGKAQNKLRSDPVTDLPGPWVSGAWRGNREQGKGKDGALYPGNEERAGVWLVFTLGF